MSSRPLVFIALVCLGVLCSSSDGRADSEDSFDEIRQSLIGPWSRARTPHFRVRSDHGTPVDSYQLDLLEASFARIADGLQIADVVQRGFRSRPIEFYYTHSHALLSRLGGRDAEGLAFAPYRVIVSLRLPHDHEVAHVLLRIASGAREGRSAPLLQEGLATWWGGTADAAPTVVLANGREVLLQDRASLEDLLTPSRMQDSTADSHDLYALAALFCEFVRERHSMSTLLGLLSRLSDSADHLEERPAAATVVQFEGLEGRPWPEIVEEFRAWAERRHFGGIATVSLPQRPPDGQQVERDHRVQWWIDGGELVVGVSTDGARSVDAEFSWGGLLPRRGAVDRAQPTWRRWGLRVSEEGVVLSDHRARRRLARLGSSVSDSENQRRQEYVLRIDLTQLPGVDPPQDVNFFVMPRVQLPGMAEPRAHPPR